MAHKKDIRCFMIQPCVQYITHTSGSFIIQWFKLEPKCKDISSTIHLYHLIGDFYNVEGKKMILFSLSDPFPSLFRLQLYPADGYHGARLLRQLRISGYKFLCCVQVNMSFSQSDLYQTVSFLLTSLNFIVHFDSINPVNKYKKRQYQDSVKYSTMLYCFLPSLYIQ